MAINWDAPIEIRDNRNGNWFWVDKIVWADKRLTSSDKVVYGTLAYFANNKSQAAFPSYTIIAEYSGVSERQCYYSIKRLQDLRYAHIQRGGGRGKPNIYTLLENPAKSAGNKKTLQKQDENPAKSYKKTLQNSTSNNTNITRLNNNSDLNFSNARKKAEEVKKRLPEILGGQTAKKTNGESTRDRQVSGNLPGDGKARGEGKDSSVVL